MRALRLPETAARSALRRLASSARCIQRAVDGFGKRNVKKRGEVKDWGEGKRVVSGGCGDGVFATVAGRRGLGKLPGPRDARPVVCEDGA